MDTLRYILSRTLFDLADKVGSGGCDDLTNELMISLIDSLSEFDTTLLVSKEKACSMLQISRSVFDQYVLYGVIPRGMKRRGFKELSWTKNSIEIAKELIAKLKGEQNINKHE